MLTLRFVGHFSGVSQTFWEEYVRPESMSVDTLGVYCKYARTHRMREHRCQDSTTNLRVNILTPTIWSDVRVDI
jgi:hypothetical protein